MPSGHATGALAVGPRCANGNNARPMADTPPVKQGYVDTGLLSSVERGLRARAPSRRHTQLVGLRVAHSQAAQWWMRTRRDAREGT